MHQNYRPPRITASSAYFTLKYRQDPARALIGQKPMFCFIRVQTQKKRVFLFCACKIYILKQIKKPKPCMYTVIKCSGHLRTLYKCRKHLPVARVSQISLVFSNDHRVLSRCNSRLRLLYLLSTLFYQSILQLHPPQPPPPSLLHAVVCETHYSSSSSSLFKHCNNHDAE